MNSRGTVTLCAAMCLSSVAFAQDPSAQNSQSSENVNGTAQNEEALDKPDPTSQIEGALDFSSETPPNPRQDSVYYAAGPEGKTLPEGAVRVRLPVRFAHGERGFDEDGNKTDPGAAVKAMGTAFVFEYGLTDDLSFQLVAPFIISSELGLDAEKFRKTSAYKSRYSRFITSAAGLLQRNGLCSSETTCLALINSGNYALPYPTKLTLPTGEELTVKAGQPIKGLADSLVLNGARPSKGATGLGDIEIGALYSVLNERGPLTNSPIFVSLGLGVRLPTGKFSDVPTAQRSTGRGTFDLGLRSNVDYTPFKGFYLSWQNQAEVMLIKGQKKKASILQSDQLNQADPTTAAALAAGSDGDGNEQDFSRKGLRNQGFIKAALGLGVLHPVAQSLGVNLQLNYDYDSEESLGDQKVGDARKQRAWQAGASIDGLAYHIPLQFDVSYDAPLSGSNVGIATENFVMTLKGYYKF